MESQKIQPKALKIYKDQGCASSEEMPTLCADVRSRRINTPVPFLLKNDFHYLSVLVPHTDHEWKKVTVRTLKRLLKVDLDKRDGEKTGSGPRTNGQTEE